MRHAFAVLLFVLPGVLVAQADPTETFQDEYKAWSRTHPDPKPSASPQEREAFNQDLAQAALTWMQQWPDDASVRLWRLRSLSKLKSASAEQLEEAGEAVVKVAKEHPYPGIRFIPYQTEVVLIWNTRDIRPDRCLQLIQEAVREIERSETANPSATKHFLPMVSNGLFQTLSIQADLARKLKIFDVAASAIDKMKQWLDENPTHRTVLENIYLLQAARLAETEGHKPDALINYSRLVSLSPKDTLSENHASALWKELGGTDSGFKLWMSFVTQQSTLSLANQAKPGWTAMNKPLTAFRGTDINGRVWSIDDLKGKTTLVNIWATWCLPCHAELPMVQKLFEQLRDRKDMQVVTVSTDDKLGAIAPFAKANNYTFPIIPISSEVINEMVGFEGIPRTWIVDSKGNARLEAIGYAAADWPDQVLQQLATVK